MASEKRIDTLKANLISPRPASVWQEAFHQTWRDWGSLSPLHRLGVALAASFRAMPAVILPGELIVGGEYLQQIAQFTYGGCIQMDGGLAERLRLEYPDDASQRFIDEVVHTWRGNTTIERIISEWSEAEQLMQGENVYWAGTWSGHAILDFSRVLMVGIEGIKRDIESRLSAAAEEDADQAAINSYDHSDFYRGLLEVCDGIICFAQAHAEEARVQAAAEPDPGRRAELERIAGICERVPARGARNFHEALQSFWFIHLLDGHDSPGRFDQYIYPFYRKSIESGEITPEQAQELIDCLWVKFNEVRSWNLCIGGLTPDGKDGTNPVSFMCLVAQRKFRMQAPNLSLRWHPGAPEEFLLKACDVIRGGGGMPALYNDDVLIPALVDFGIPVEDARDYALNGCSQVDIQGKSHMGLEDGELNLLKCLEIALHNGRDPYTRAQLGLRTGDPREFTCFEELMDAYRKQVEFFTAKLTRAANSGQRIRSRHAPNLLRSLFIDDCVAKGIDYNTGGSRYNHGQILTQGIANTADSLAAIRKLVFEEKTLTMERLLEALAKDFEGEDYLRHLLLCAPKFGNDDPYVDSIAEEIVEHWFNELKNHRTWRGGSYGAGVIVFVRMMSFGRKSSASADGRKAHTPLADSVGPSQGMDLKGPTAMLSSVAKLPQKLAPCAVVLNLKLDPKSVSGEEGLRKMAALVKGYFLQGGQQLQINVVDRETLLAAKESPEAYRSLVVRVGGFSAYFVNLDSTQQDEIILRTESTV